MMILSPQIANLQEAHELQKSLGINDECRGQCECKLGLCTFVAETQLCSGSSEMQEGESSDEMLLVR